MLSFTYMQDLSNPTYGGDDSRVAQPTVGNIHKETLVTGETARIEEINPDVEVSAELAKAGVLKKSETIDLPPDIANLGVSAVGAAQPLPQTVTIQLPLDDTQIVEGLGAKLTSSMHWLAQWCVFRLKKAHIAIKIVAGKIVRQQA